MKMESGTLATAMEREHHEIDRGIEGFSSESAGDQKRTQSLQRAIDALRRHIYLEEIFLFPPMKKDLAIQTTVMLREHGEIWRKLDEIEAGLGEKRSEAALQEACRELLVQLERHNSKEEPIFYAQADDSLSEAESAVLKDLIETGEMPEGWLCRQATGS